MVREDLWVLSVWRKEEVSVAIVSVVAVLEIVQRILPKCDNQLFIWKKLEEAHDTTSNFF